MVKPQDKEMKMQWITVDGRRTPIILPQIWDHEKEDWVVTSTENPLPTQVTGSNVEEVYAFDSEVITDSRVLSPTIIIESFRKISFLIVNTTEVTLDLSIFVGGDSLKLGSSKIYDGSNFMDKTIEIPNERNRLFFDISAFNINAVDGLPYSLRFGATPQKTVEVGSLSMVILGGK